MGGIVWLASYPKSGNTWTRNFLHNLLGGEEETHDINKMQVRTAWDSSIRWYSGLVPDNKKLEELSRDEFAAIRMQANENLANIDKSGLVFVKTHNAMVADCGVPMINPKVTAGAVYIIRNPLDVAISYSYHLSASIDETIAFMCTSGVHVPASEMMSFELQGSWSEHVMSWTRKKSKSLFVMRYEEMLDKPHSTFAQLVKFLQIPADDKRISQAIEQSSFERLKRMEQEKGFTEKPKPNKNDFFRSGTKDQWRDILSEKQIIEIINSHREQMERFGYIPDEYR